jgi:hypothetical protein
MLKMDYGADLKQKVINGDFVSKELIWIYI